MLTPHQQERLYKQQYRLVGRHSAVKICLWTKQCLRQGKVCYKQHFYDVHCGKCLEMSPAITCNQRCLHCWRDTSVFSPEWEGEADEPKEIIEKAIAERKQLMIGFGGREKIDKKYFQDCLTPDHAAISLTGEPTLYPKLPQLIDSFFEDFHFRTVFLVTNGTQPEMLKRIEKESKHYPTNLYLSLEAWDEESHKMLNNPVTNGTWENVQKSMKYLSPLKDKTRTILRITLIWGLNMDDPKKFVPYIKLMQPTCIEVKGYGFLGYSQKRLKKENEPAWEETKKFARELEKLTSYKISGEQEASDVVQLSEE